MKECTLHFTDTNKGLKVITHINSDLSRTVIAKITPLIVLKSILEWQRTAVRLLETKEYMKSFDEIKRKHKQKKEIIIFLMAEN